MTKSDPILKHTMMSIPRILIFLLCFVVSSKAQITPRNIFGKGYSLEAVQQSLVPLNQWHPYPQNSSEWKAQVPDSVLQKIIKDGEKALNYKFEPISATISLDYVRSGDRNRHGNISFGKRNSLFQLLLAESIEDKGRFMEAILNGIWSICEESYWGVPAHIGHTGLPDVTNPVVDLFSAETASVLAIADYWVGKKLDKINPLIRKRIYHETNVRIFNPMLNNPERFGWMSKTKPVNNWNPWIMSNWIMSNLLLEKDESRRARMLYGAMIGLDSYLNSLGEDGGCDEGPSYWFAAGGSVFDGLELIQSATQNRVNIYQNELIKKMANYVYKTHISGEYFVNFADADPTLRPDGLMLYRFGKAIQEPQLQHFGEWAFTKYPQVKTEGYQRMRRIQNLLTVGSIKANDTEYQPVNEAWISDIQVMTARDNTGLFLATHGGHNDESHNHNDVGDFIIYYKGKPMIIDAGRGNYTARTFSKQRYELWFTQSQHHNLPMINGIGQKDGRSFEAHDVVFLSNEKEIGLTMNIAGAYPKDAGIQTWKRGVKLLKQKHQIEINDDFVLSQNPQSLQQVLMTICQVDTSKEGQIIFTNDDTQLVATYDPNLFSVSTDMPSTEGMEYDSFKTKWGKKLVTRVLLTHKKPNTKGKYQLKFEGK